MQIEQAIFTSAATHRMRGYHLVARSPGVSDYYAQQLAHWGPTQGALLSSRTDFESLNFFPLQDDRVAISRTVHGGPEYSGRGELQTFTRILIFGHGQLRGYEENPWLALRAARALGLLRFTGSFAAQMPRAELPDTTPLGIDNGGYEMRCSSRIDEASELLRDDKRLAIRGEKDVEAALDHLFHQTPVDERLTVSFTTGLAPSSLRPFRVHFLPVRSKASLQGLTTIH